MTHLELIARIQCSVCPCCLSDINAQVSGFEQALRGQPIAQLLREAEARFIYFWFAVMLHEAGASELLALWEEANR